MNRVIEDEDYVQILNDPAVRNQSFEENLIEEERVAKKQKEEPKTKRQENTKPDSLLEELVIGITGNLSVPKSQLAKVYETNGAIVKPGFRNDIDFMISGSTKSNKDIEKCLVNQYPIFKEEMVTELLKGKDRGEVLRNPDLRNPNFEANVKHVRNNTLNLPLYDEDMPLRGLWVIVPNDGAHEDMVESYGGMPFDCIAFGTEHKVNFMLYEGEERTFLVNLCLRYDIPILTFEALDNLTDDREIDSLHSVLTDIRYRNQHFFENCVIDDITIERQENLDETELAAKPSSERCFCIPPLCVEDYESLSDKCLQNGLFNVIDHITANGEDINALVCDEDKRTNRETQEFLVVAELRGIPVVNRDFVLGEIKKLTKDDDNLEGKEEDIDVNSSEESDDDSNDDGKPLQGITMCLSGTLSKPRPKLAKMYTDLGAIVKSSVTRDVMLLVSEEMERTSKINKAIKLLKPIVIEEVIDCLIARTHKYYDLINDHDLRNENFEENLELSIVPHSKAEPKSSTKKKTAAKKEEDKEEGEPLRGISLCLSGKLSESRPKLTKKYTALGATVKSSISRDIMILVTEESKRTTKIEKAIELNKPIVKEELMDGLIQGSQYDDLINNMELRNANFDENLELFVAGSFSKPPPYKRQRR